MTTNNVKNATRSLTRIIILKDQHPPVPDCKEHNLQILAAFTGGGTQNYFQDVQQPDAVLLYIAEECISLLPLVHQPHQQSEETDHQEQVKSVAQPLENRPVVVSRETAATRAASERVRIEFSTKTTSFHILIILILCF